MRWSENVTLETFYHSREEKKREREMKPPGLPGLFGDPSVDRTSDCRVDGQGGSCPEERVRVTVEGEGGGYLDDSRDVLSCLLQ